GVSHFFEHMVFKGSEKYKRGDIDLVTYRCGGENNAYTTHDMTGYWFHVHSSHLDEVLDILADTCGRSTLDPKEFELERGPVLQEMNIWLDGPWGELERTLEKTVYTKSRYRHPVLGWREDVEKLTRDRMMEYYKAYYKPNNASLIVVGDVRKEEVFRRAEKFFGGIPGGKDADEAHWKEPTQEAERSVEVKTELPSDRFIMAFRTDAAGTDDDLVLDVVSTILGDGRNSRLKTKLVKELELAGEGNVEVTNYSRRREGMFYVQVEVALEGSPEAARKAVIQELEAISTKPVKERELRRAKNLLRAKFAFDLESQNELTSRMGYFEALGQPDYIRTYMDRIEAITPEQVLEVARRTFQAERRTVAIGLAKPKRAALGTPAPKGPPKRRAAASAALQAIPSLGEVAREVLPNGLTLLAKKRSDVPVVSMQALVNAGQIFEPEDKAGLAELVGSLLDEGIEDDQGRRRSGDEIAGDIEFVGGQYATSANGISVKVLSEHSDVAFNLLRDLLRYPSFPKERFEKLREDQLAEIESLDQDPTRVARRLFLEAVYKGHPFHRPSVGYKDAVKALTPDDVEAYHRRLFRPENTLVAVVGDIEPAEALRQLRSRLEGWKGEGPWQAPVAAAASQQQEPRPTISTYKAQQVRIHLGHLGIVRTDPDYPALRVMETILLSSPGFTNRLARNVRDLQGLAYDVNGSITGGAGFVACPFQIVLGVEAKDKDKGLQAVMKELEEFLKTGPTVEEVRDAKDYLLHSFVSSWETVEDLADYLIMVQRFGLGQDYPAQYHRAVAAVTPEEVLRVARKHLDLKNLTTVIVGPVDKNGKLIDGEQNK
ncbi:MAG TPA: pitrilysin family protein, partial [Planctomycetota bacterium]|nr:pitrilysin family protein [Planctomycetota bacterium]